MEPPFRSSSCSFGGVCHLVTNMRGTVKDRRYEDIIEERNLAKVVHCERMRMNASFEKFTTLWHSQIRHIPVKNPFLLSLPTSAADGHGHGRGREMDEYCTKYCTRRVQWRQCWLPRLQAATVQAHTLTHTPQQQWSRYCTQVPCTSVRVLDTFILHFLPECDDALHCYEQ